MGFKVWIINQFHFKLDFVFNPLFQITTDKFLPFNTEPNWRETLKYDFLKV